MALIDYKVVAILAMTYIVVSFGCIRMPFLNLEIKGKDNKRDLSVRDRWIVDQSRRVRLFHGFNSVMKHSPWYDEQLLNKSRLQMYREWGFNVVRLGIMWPGVEPMEDRINTTYINIIRNIIQLLDEYGLYVILDMHQDVASSAFGGEGFPGWFVDKLPKPEHPFPWPFPHPPSGASWAQGYFTQAVSEVFQHLYSNVSGATDDFSHFWNVVATAFVDESNVLGYEILNEPWVGDFYSNPKLLLPANAGKINFLPLYDTINDVIRKVDEKTLLFYEPSTFAVFLNGKYTGSGFPRVPGGEDFRNRSVYSYHYYCWLLRASISSESFPYVDRVLCDDLLGPVFFSNTLQEIKEIGGGSFLTEFGLCEPNNLPNSTGSVECNFVMRQADKHLQSWTYWDSDFFNKSSQVRWEVVKPFARTYARSVAGIPMDTSFNITTAEFYLQYSIDSSIEEPTEIFLPQLHYPEGINVTVSPGLKWSYDETKSVIFVSQTSISGTVSVYVMPKKDP